MHMISFKEGVHLGDGVLVGKIELVSPLPDKSSVDLFMNNNYI